MEKYQEEMRPIVRSIIKNLKESVYPSLKTAIDVHLVGAFSLGILQLNRKDPFHTLDLAVYSTLHPTELLDLQKCIQSDLKHRDSSIKLRGDDFSIKTWIDKTYPTLRCSDPDYEAVLNVRLIMLREAAKDDYLVL